MRSAAQSRAPTMFHSLKRCADRSANGSKRPLYQELRPGQTNAPDDGRRKRAFHESPYVSRIMRQGHDFCFGRGRLFQLEQPFFFYKIAQNTVLGNWELMALRKRKLILIGRKYPGAKVGFVHNQKAAVRSIYYKDGWSF